MAKINNSSPWGNGAALQNSQGQQNMGGALGNSSLSGLGNPHTQTQLATSETYLRQENHALRSELNSQKSIRNMDQVLLRRHYRIWAWLQDTHPEVVKEFEAVEDLLKASGESF